MRITPCPKCGRMPKISEMRCAKNGVRRRWISCPNFHYVLEPHYNDKYDRMNKWYIVFVGEGDDNAVYKRWNELVKEG